VVRTNSSFTFRTPAQSLRQYEIAILDHRWTDRRDLHRFENAVPGHVDDRVAVALEKSAAALLDVGKAADKVVEARRWK
jgi:hypothetical protein